METNDCCVRCGTPKSTGPECPKCGVIYAKAERGRTEDTTPLIADKKNFWRQQTQGARLGIIVAVGFAVIFLVIYTGNRSDPLYGKKEDSSVQRKPVDALPSMAHVQCKRLVGQMLKAPATAKFPFADRTIAELGNKTYEITSYVDAQNSFGALIRNNWTCKMHFKGGDPFEFSSWDLLDIKVE